MKAYSSIIEYVFILFMNSRFNQDFSFPPALRIKFIYYV